MREWWDSLAQRERRILMAGAAALAAMLYYLMIWEPLHQQAGQLEQELADARELAGFLQQVETEARQLGGGQQTASAAGSNRSLLAVVDQSGKSAGLGDAIKRIQPEGDETVRLWLEDARFEELVRWLAQLKQTHGVVIANGTIDRDDAAGLVKARLAMERAS